jgi:hydrogenase/urease accessory protein HupE
MRLAIALVLAVATHARAHPLAPALLELTEARDGAVDVVWRRPALGVADATVRPLLPARCRDRADRRDVAAQGAVTTRWTTECGAEGLVGGVVGVDGLGPAGAEALLRIGLADGRVVQRVLRPADASLVVPARTSPLDVLRSYAGLGVEHILTGADHLLFVFGLLLLVPGTAVLVRTITAFTVGHSVTLALVALGVARVPTRPVELLIALTVLTLAVELGRDGPTLARRFPWAMALTFGLLHGFGFAGALRDVGLPAGDVPLALFSFNVGIEAGQLAFVAAVLLATVAVRRLRWPLPARARLVPEYAMGSLAALWCLERAAALFQ